MDERLSLICHLRLLRTPLGIIQTWFGQLPFSVLYGNMPDWDRRCHSLLSLPDAALRRAKWQGGKPIELSPQSISINADPCLTTHCSWCLQSSDFSSWCFEATWQRLRFHHHAHYIRPFKTGPPPGWFYTIMAFWNGIGSSENLCRVILAVPIPFMPQSIQPMRNQSILHLTLITFTASSNQASSVPPMHAKRRIITSGSGLSETRNYPHKDKRVAIRLVRHGLCVGLHSSPNAIRVIYQWAIVELRVNAIGIWYPGMVSIALCVCPLHWREDRLFFSGRNCAVVTVNFPLRLERFRSICNLTHTWITPLSIAW